MGGEVTSNSNPTQSWGSRGTPPLPITLKPKTHMALQFKVYEPSNTLESLGTVNAIIPGGKLKFVPGTIDRYNNGVIKSMNMILIDKKGASATCPLSKRVSATIKKALDSGSTKEEVAAVIFNLEIGEDEDGRMFIMAPRGSSGEEEEFSFSEVKKVKTTYEDLVAF